MALNGYGALSLVVKFSLGYLFNLIFVWFYVDWKPTLRLKYNLLIDIIPSWLYLTGSSFLHTGTIHFYSLFLGKMFSFSDLAFFNKAQSLQQIPINNLSSVINRVILPILAEVNPNIKLLKYSAKKLLFNTALFIYPILVFLVYNSDSIIYLLLGDNWLPSADYFELFCIIGFLFPIHLININILISTDNNKKLFFIEIIKKTLLILFLFLTFKYGILFVLYGMLLNSCIGLYINTYFTKKIIDYNIISQIKDCFLPFSYSLILYFILYLINFYFPLNLYFSVIVNLFIFILLYISILFLHVDHINNLFKSYFKKLSLNY